MIANVALGARPRSWVTLCYHDVQPVMPVGGGGPSHFTVPLASFELMLDKIAALGYVGCSLAHAIAQPGRPRVAITFDDGDVGQYHHAFPALVARDMTATFYITTDWVGRRGYMTWKQIQNMSAHGMSIQSHTRSHPFLSELNEEALRAELSGSKTLIESHIGRPVNEIAFPGGDPPARGLRLVLAETGYDIAVGTRWGVDTDVRAQTTRRGFVHRCSMRGPITEDLARRIIQADPWLAVSYTAKESTLRRLRSALGPTRYAQWRRRVLDVLARN
jgi:peptidoglycan/xylan/chitin deacetylase (PgdA/CDA1 family)